MIFNSKTHKIMNVDPFIKRLPIILILMLLASILFPNNLYAEIKGEGLSSDLHDSDEIGEDTDRLEQEIENSVYHYEQCSRADISDIFSTNKSFSGN